MFNDPQGMALRGETLFVADRKNHQIRSIDLNKKLVHTIAGVGKQGFNRNARGPGREIALNSPWDLFLIKDQLYIAMAGHHQIWRLDLNTGSLMAYAGNGREEIIDGSLAQSSFAQPSGLTSDGNFLFVADSEVSAVRAVPLNPSHEVRSLIGSGLFNFGDKDGIGPNVLLQHCLGVSMWNGNLLIADTYNNKIKMLEPKTRQVRTLFGDGRAGDSDTIPQFNEPAGIHVVADKAYVADTNNHKIRVINLKTRQVQTLAISGLLPVEVKNNKPAFRNITNVALDQLVLPSTGKVEFEFKLHLATGMKVEPSSPIAYLVEGLDENKTSVFETFGDLFGTRRLEVPVEKLKKAKKLKVSIEYYPCTEGQGICQVKSQSWEIPVTFKDKAPSNIRLETRTQ
jgi:hypothetical protein